ncbi:MAG: helix-turn-helix domain-containing protein [Thermoplasmata archaeon]|jgi:hypothetical protein|nr:helix-turn-helix domain-containing protein [Thermoplasmata archaeon]
MKMPCELIVTHILPAAKGALAKELVTRHGMTQVQVARMFGVTSAAISQYMKGVRGGNSLIDKSAYRDDFYRRISETADSMVQGMDISDALCQICTYVKESGLLKALYVFEGYPGDSVLCFECPKIIMNLDGGGYEA